MNRKKVFITGAASGIGKAAALRFASEGYDVCLNDIQAEKLSALVAELASGNHLALAGSYADPDVIAEGERMMREKWGRLDALVNCAGVFEKTEPFEMNISKWRIVFDTMVNGCFLVSQMAVKLMSEGGRIVHITSIHGTRAEKFASSYATAKAAINQYCRSAALELAPKGILVNAIAPGFVNTAMSVVDGENELEGQWFKDNYVDSHHLPLRRAADASEIAGVALFLAGNDASYITGQVIAVDGGLSITF